LTPGVDNLLVSKQSVCANDAKKREREKEREKEIVRVRARERVLERAQTESNKCTERDIQ